MIEKTKNFLILNLFRISTLRHFLKLQFFKSPMSEKFSLVHTLHFLKAKIVFKTNNVNFICRYQKEANKLNKFGFVTFSNIPIRKNCEIILNKLKENSKVLNYTKIINGSPTEEFRDELINIFNNGVDEFIKGSFKSDYYIYYHVLYKSERLLKDQKPEGSELWHADGGPGTCMNLMICHSPLNKKNGAMKIIPWRESKSLLNKLYFEYKRLIRDKKKEKGFENLNRLELREIKCALLEKFINQKSLNYFQPNSLSSGTIYAFRNNCVHAGGYTELGHERFVSVMHIYPSTKKSTIEEKFMYAHNKIDGHPEINNFS